MNETVHWFVVPNDENSSVIGPFESEEDAVEFGFPAGDGGQIRTASAPNEYLNEWEEA